MSKGRFHGGRSPAHPICRAVLARTGKLAAVGALSSVLAACVVEPNPTVTGPDGRILIQVTDGRNCHDGGCVRLDLAGRDVAMPGREPVKVPEDIAVARGTVTPEEFVRLRRLARTAPRKESGGDGGGGAGGADAGGGAGGGGDDDVGDGDDGGGRGDSGF